MRFFQSSGPIDLPPGGSGTIVVAYIFAAPVGVGGCPGGGCDVKPAATNADLTILGDPTRMANGVNKIDTVMGYAGFTNAGPGRHRSDPGDPGRVPDRAGLAAPQGADGPGGVRRQVPAAVRARAARVLPGAGQQPGLGAVAAEPDGVDGQPGSVLRGGEPADIDGVANPLYDPNFRANDVEGYRVYRGRVDNPSELQLLAQFD